MSPEEALLNQVEKLLQEDLGSEVVITTDEETNEMTSLFFQTSSMQEAFSTYPVVLIMDSTYKLCDNDMPLIVFEVFDCFGAGRIAGYTFVKSEDKPIVAQALQLLCTSDKEAFKKRQGLHWVLICRSQVGVLFQVVWNFLSDEEAYNNEDDEDDGNAADMIRQVQSRSNETDDQTDQADHLTEEIKNDSDDDDDD